MTIEPQQELFTTLKLSLESKGHKVFDDGMPGKDEPYPFDYLGENQQTDTVLKNAIMGVVHQTIHVWHDAKHRGTVSAMLGEIKAVFYQLGHTANYAWRVQNVTTRIISDTSTGTKLLHGVIEADFHFS